MNTRTKKELIVFIDQVEALTSAVLMTIGMQTAQQVVQSAENLKAALEQDETITETGVERPLGHVGDLNEE